LRVPISVAAAAVLAVGASNAQATLSARELAHMRHIAAVAWPGNSCTGRVRFAWTADATLDALEPGAVAAASPQTCQVVASRDRWQPWKAYLCTVLVHESGHLAGRPHVADPRNVMYGGWLGDAIWPACRRAFPAPTAYVVLQPSGP
jgi:hypothetical protein